MFRIATCFLLAVHLVNGQLSGYTEVGNLSCESSPPPPYALELVKRTEQSGTVMSPCYDFNDSTTEYQQELAAGIKLINITFDSPFLAGYRLTIRDFQIDRDDRVYIGDGITASSGNLRDAVRNFTLTSNSTTDDKIYVQTGDETGTITDVLTQETSDDKLVLVNFESVFLTLYTTSDTPMGRGFLIDYDADINKCLFTGDNVYCKNSGACTRTGFNTSSCDCTGTGYQGATCEDDIDECATSTDDCDPNASCANTDGSFTCTCNANYTGNGKTCTDIDECAASDDPCGVTGTCVNKENGYDCTCSPGYEGGIGGVCTDLDECILDTEDCDTNANCTNTVGSFTCTCTQFYTGDGKTCTDIDDCVDDPCGVTGTCVNRVGGFNCTCAEGYEGGVDAACTDIDECSDGTDNCHSNASCTNTPVATFTCTCVTGYTGNGTSCTDNDECSLETDNCHDNADCTNNDGSFTCRCKTGYSGDGETCTDINECDVGTHNCHANANCANNDGSFTCTCKTGFTGGGVTCADNNECTLGTDNCDDNAECTNNVGSFTCACNTGYNGNGVSCTEINECTDGSNDCHSQATCKNEPPGSFNCTCNSGFTGNGTFCTDINECDDSTLNNCDTNADCINIDASFNCECRTGWTGTGVTCTDINECTAGTDNCNDVNGTCNNNDGSFTCACRNGYSGDGVTCLDIDECTLGTHNCTLSETRCSNTVGGFDCICSRPEFRGTPGACDYYCLHNSTCTQDRAGFIDMPEYYDGAITYAAFDETTWNFQTSSTGFAGIRFTFKAFSTEIRDDFLSIYPGSEEDIPNEIVGISGSSTATLYNKQNPVTESGNIQATGSAVEAYLNLTGAEPTLTLSSSDVFLAFTSDRLNVSFGFRLEFEYDMDDCPSPSRCQNGGNCVDKAFRYQCENCPGYEGVDCDLDIDECSATPRPCHENADCENTDGSFICTCRPDYTGNGVTCNPLIVLSNFQVGRTTSSLNITFDITEAWRNTNYLLSFNITVEDPSGTKSIFPVTLDLLLAGPVTIPNLSTYTPYIISVVVNETGPMYGSSVLQDDLGTQTFYTAESTPGVPINLNAPAGTALRDRVTLTWEKPVETGFGVVTHYEISYAISSASDAQTTASLRSISTAEMTLILDNTYTSFTWVGLPSYIDLVFKIRAFSSQGAGDYTTAVLAFTGQICDPWTSFAGRVACPLREGLLKSEGFPRAVTGSDNLVIEQYWSFDLTSFPGWRPNLKFFRTVLDESTLDYGYGNIDITDHDTEKENRVKVYTGNRGVVGPDPEAGIDKNTSIPAQNTLWFAFISDRTRKEVGFQVEVEIDGNNCDSSPCLHGGACTNAKYRYTCDCSATAWTGDSCEQPKIVPTVTCTTGKRDMNISYSVSSQWASDETVYSGFTVSVVLAGANVNTAEKTSDETTHTVDGLTPYTTYTVRVTGKSSIRSDVVFMESSQSCQTQEDVPTAPRTVTVTNGSESLAVSWVEPAEPNGVLKYSVSWEQTDNNTYGETRQSGSASDITDLTFTITGLKAYRNYAVTVTASTSAGNTPADPVSETTNPGAPPTITGDITVVPTLSARVDWTLGSATFVGPLTVSVTAVSDLHSPETKSVTLSGPTYDVSTYTYEGLEEDQTYNFTVTASTTRPPVQTFTKIGVNTNASAPGLPATFTYDRPTSTFTWSLPDPLDRNGEITGFKLASSSSVPGFTTQNFDQTVTSFVLLNVPAFTNYTFTLQAVNHIGEGVVFTLPIETKEEVPDSVDASTISQDVITSDSITISWTAQDPLVGQTVYKISYTDAAGNAGTPFQTASTTISLTGLDPYTLYTITIIASTGAGDATPITYDVRTAEATPPAVQNLAASFNPYTISVTWDAPSPANGVLGAYTVSWMPDGGTVTTTDTSYTINGVTKSETRYNINVTAQTGAGQGPSSMTSETTPILLLNAPTAVAIDEEKSTSARINATAPDNANALTVTGYFVILSQDKDDCQQKKDVQCRANERTEIDADALPYTIGNLLPYRKYVVSIGGISAAGPGASSENVNFDTLAAAPNPPTFTQSATQDGFAVTIAAGLPFTGPANYTVTVTAGDTSMSQSVNETTALEGIVVNVNGLAGSTDYVITVVAANSAGSTQAASTPTIRTSPVAPSFAVARTSTTSLTVTITADPTATAYTVSYVEDNCTNCNTTSETINTTEYVISDLGIYTLYLVSVYTTNNVGAGRTANITMRTKAGQPSLVDPEYSLPRVIDVTDPNFRGAYNVILENLCNIKDKVFVQTQGDILRVAYFVREEGSNENINASQNVVYGFANDKSPSPVWKAFTVTCNSARRRKRSVVDSGVMLGADNTCADDSTTECNGPLKPSTNYTFQACGYNEENNFICTEPSADYTTDPAPGLTAGEIAAIVICSILLVVLIILLIVYLVKRRNQKGKARISRRGKDNPSFEAKPSAQQQKYQLDPAADPQTEYSGTNA